MSKATFSLDAATVEALRKLASRQRKPQSLVVREAIAHYAAQEDRLSDAEREIEEIRRARRASGLHREKRIREAMRRAAR